VFGFLSYDTTARRKVNYNYMARKHVDGNNIGPSFIQSIGDHKVG
jgi:hypothetical protein